MIEKWSKLVKFRDDQVGDYILSEYIKGGI